MLLLSILKRWSCKIKSQTKNNINISALFSSYFEVGRKRSTIHSIFSREIAALNKSTKTVHAVNVVFAWLWFLRAYFHLSFCSLFSWKTCLWSSTDCRNKYYSIICFSKWFFKNWDLSCVLLFDFVTPCCMITIMLIWFWFADKQDGTCLMLHLWLTVNMDVPVYSSAKLHWNFDRWPG